MPRPYVVFVLALSVIFCSFIPSCNSEADNFVVRDLEITPSEVTAGEYVLFEFRMDNKGYRGVRTTWTLEIDGEEVSTKQITAEERDTTRGYFRITAEGTGRHTVVIKSGGGDFISGEYMVRAP